MSLFKNIFKNKDTDTPPVPVRSYEDFWNWFAANQQVFYNVVKERGDIRAVFFAPLSEKLDQLKEGYHFLTGINNENIAELIFTADGVVKNVVFVEELVQAAPAMENWKIISLKPAVKIEDTVIDMDGFAFSSNNIHFYANDTPACPDEIDITVVHNDFTPENKDAIVNGTYIFLDNYLGELDFINNIDSLAIIGPADATRDLIPISKLKDFLIWRQKEFVEKYDGIAYDSGQDSFSVFEASFEDGGKLFALINMHLLSWEGQVSHPWMAILIIRFGAEGAFGLSENDYALLNTIEDEIMAEITSEDGIVNIGRQTVSNEREVYFAAKDFRKISKLLYHTQLKYASNFTIGYDLYKDKYWQSMNRYKQS
ncbi:Family of unknown function [Filimonas lacunae]|uniref:Uncharacterized protein n=1 Tax=Filimonas lacunae TaxID=477680 RepID=A0A173MI59_9BACT|nr:DUF695 domain-containing protein [Filimonas lacunae]BAV07304.1 hypothetical protein FLA_3327 [Filimonas lacunae]SIS91683.1 Family of unknown function [Filimonas lacunae]